MRNRQENKVTKQDKYLPIKDNVKSKYVLQ